MPQPDLSPEPTPDDRLVVQLRALGLLGPPGNWLRIADAVSGSSATLRFGAVDPIIRTGWSLPPGMAR